MDQAPHGTGLIVIAAIILFSFYRRFRSHVGRQPIRPRSMTLRMVFLAFGAVAMLAVPHLAPSARIEELAGIVLGAGLAWWGLRMTQFSADGAQRYYTPNTWLGLAISTLFIARIAYRVMVLAPVVESGTSADGGLPPQMLLAGAQTGLTLATFGLVAGYYLAYYAGILHRSRSLPMDAKAVIEGQS